MKKWISGIIIGVIFTCPTAAGASSTSQTYLNPPPPPANGQVNTGGPGSLAIYSGNNSVAAGQAGQQFGSGGKTERYTNRQLEVILFNANQAWNYAQSEEERNAIHLSVVGIGSFCSPDKDEFVSAESGVDSVVTNG